MKISGAFFKKIANRLMEELATFLKQISKNRWTLDDLELGDEDGKRVDAVVKHNEFVFLE